MQRCANSEQLRAYEDKIANEEQKMEDFLFDIKIDLDQLDVIIEDIQTALNNSEYEMTVKEFLNEQGILWWNATTVNKAKQKRYIKDMEIIVVRHAPTKAKKKG